jgi:predicted RNase H-like HicB family nuclease
MKVQYCYTIEVHPAQESKGYWVSVPAIPACVAQGKTYDEAVERAQKVIAGHLKRLLRRGELVPLEASLPSVMGVQIVL